jgi:hypothetical protein
MSSVHIAPEEEGGQCGSSLVQTYEMLKSQLDLEGNMPDVFSRACVMLGVPAEGAILDQAARCRAALLGDGSRPRPKPEDVVEEAPVWQGETPVFPQEGAPVMGVGVVAKVVGEAAPQREEMAREASGDLKGRAVGIEDRSLVPDAWLSASGSWPDAGPTLSRFRHDRPHSSCWSPDKPGKEAKSSWIQIDMQTVQHVTGVATQGNSAISYGHQWTTSFQLQTSQDGRSWATFSPRGSGPVYLEGNKDKSSVVYHAFEPPLAARYVRLCPKSWNDANGWNVPCLRWEVFTLEGRGDAFDWLRERGGAVVRRRPWHDRAREGALWIHAPADVIGCNWNALPCPCCHFFVPCLCPCYMQMPALPPEAGCMEQASSSS